MDFVTAVVVFAIAIAVMAAIWSRAAEVPGNGNPLWEKDQMRSTRSLVMLGLIAGLIGSLFIVSSASAQDEPPEVVNCTDVVVDPPAAVIYAPSTRDVVVGTFDDGSQLAYFDVVVGQALVAPDGLLWVDALKCDLVEPEPTPTPVPPTPTPEPTPVPPEPTPEPTPVPPQPTPEPTTEVRGIQQEQGEELAETGVESGWLAVIGIAFVAGGALLVGTAVTRRSRI